MIKINKLMKETDLKNVLFLDRESAKKTLTEKRMELITTIKNKEVKSIRDLARKVDRGNNVVLNDLTLLAENGIIEFKTEKNRKIPKLMHNHVFITPLLYLKE